MGIGVFMAAIILSTDDPIVSIRWNLVGSRSPYFKCKFGLYIMCCYFSMPFAFMFFSIVGVFVNLLGSGGSSSRDP